MKLRIINELDSLRSWKNDTKQNIHEYGIKGAKISLKDLFWRGGLRTFGKYIWNYGTPIFNLEWDVLIVLDACRYDLILQLKDEYPFLNENIEYEISVASATFEWMKKNFTDFFNKEMKNTSYIVGNPYSDSTLNSSDWCLLSEPWKTHRNGFGTIPPRPITDQAIDAGRKLNHDRMILHYMQPHQPFRSYRDTEGNTWNHQKVWRKLEFGELSYNNVWEAYIDNLRWVLDDIPLLLKNIDSKRLVITSDHANAFGEWGIYGHPRHVPIPILKRVPWIELSATDEETHTPEFRIDEEASEEMSAERRLKDLGYLN